MLGRAPLGTALLLKISGTLELVTTRAEDLTPDDVLSLAPSWELALRAERKTPGTIVTYRKGIDQFVDYCRERAFVPLDRTTVRSWVADRLADGTAPATMRARLLSVRRLVAWLVDEGEIEADPLVGIKPPRDDDDDAATVVPLTDDQLRAMLGALTAVPGSAPAGELFRARRDEAILRLMVETGLRAGEAIALCVDDVDLVSARALVRRGKGGKARIVPFGPQAARAIDRYLRLRRKHRRAAEPALWLGDRGRRLSYTGLYLTLRARAEAVGIEGFHPHQLRHTAAHRWLSAGGSEGGLMAVAGWSSPAMLTRYTKARATERALAEAAGLNLGEGI